MPIIDGKKSHAAVLFAATDAHQSQENGGSVTPHFKSRGWRDCRVALAPAVAIGVVLALGSWASPARASTTTFTTPGSHTWTVPAGITSVDVEVAGGGGGGGRGVAVGAGCGGIRNFDGQPRAGTQSGCGWGWHTRRRRWWWRCEFPRRQRSNLDDRGWRRWWWWPRSNQWQRSRW